MAANTLGRYKIIREIARSNDVVYEAVDASINRRVALKELLMPPNLAGAQRQERVQRFYREARAAGSLSHPNIVTIFEAGEENGRHFIAMEFLEGQTLRDIIEIEGKVAADRAIEIMRQVCDALAYAHSMGVVHRDIKPENIQILPNGSIKITDFGIARLMEEPSLTAEGQVFGTPSYMSPEQVAGKSLDHRTDIFSLGIVLYEMVVGRKPFIGDSVVTITYNIMNQYITVPPGIPMHIERVILRALKKDPNERYSTAADMAADLEPGTVPNAAKWPDPQGLTIQSPIPMSTPPSTQYSPVPQSAPDPFANMKPGDMSLPRIPSKPLLSSEAKYFIKILLLVIGICFCLIFLIWLFSTAYGGYQQQMMQSQIEAHINNGEAYYNQQSYHAAIQEFNAALNMNDDPRLEATLKHNIAVCYIAIGDQSLKSDLMEDAGRWWNKALQMEPKNPEALDRVAMIYLNKGNEAARMGDRNTAMQWWKKALETSPGTDSGLAAGRNIQRYMNGSSEM